MCATLLVPKKTNNLSHICEKNQIVSLVFFVDRVWSTFSTEMIYFNILVHVLHVFIFFRNFGCSQSAYSKWDVDIPGLNQIFVQYCVVLMSLFPLLKRAVFDLSLA